MKDGDKDGDTYDRKYCLGMIIGHMWDSFLGGKQMRPSDAIMFGMCPPVVTNSLLSKMAIYSEFS